MKYLYKDQNVPVVLVIDEDGSIRQDKKVNAGENVGVLLFGVGDETRAILVAGENVNYGATLEGNKFNHSLKIRAVDMNSNKLNGESK